MSPYNLPVTLRHCPVFQVALNMALLYLRAAMTVRVNYTTPNVEGHSLPDQFRATIQDNLASQTDLLLTRAKYIDPNIQVSTLSKGQNGLIVQTFEQLDKIENVGYYQSPANKAAIEVTRVAGSEPNKFILLLKGGLTLAGIRYYLTHDYRTRRDAASSSPLSPEDVTYSLHKLPPPPVIVDDLVHAPRTSQKRERLQPQIPGSTSSETPSKTVGARDYVYWGSHLLVDVVAVVDEAKYAEFRNKSQSKAETLQAMRSYYLYIFNDVDVRYQGVINIPYRIHVILARLVVAEDPSASTFTYNLRTAMPGENRYVVDTNDALTEFDGFARSIGREFVYPNDHLMLFSGYDLARRMQGGTMSTRIVGLAYVDTVCGSVSTSIVEDIDHFDVVYVVAHELGHALSAQHDGYENQCQAADRYIMSTGTYQTTQSTLFNPWHFSPCSTRYFSRFIKRQLATDQGRACLLQQLPVRSGRSALSDRLPGHEVSIDDQCRLMFGNDSVLVREPGSSLADVCHSMLCSHLGAPSGYLQVKALEGTSCGPGQRAVDRYLNI